MNKVEDDDVVIDYNQKQGTAKPLATAEDWERARAESQKIQLSVIDGNLHWQMAVGFVLGVALGSLSMIVAAAIGGILGIVIAVVVLLAGYLGLYFLQPKVQELQRKRFASKAGSTVASAYGSTLDHEAILGSATIGILATVAVLAVFILG